MYTLEWNVRNHANMYVCSDGAAPKGDTKPNKLNCTIKWKL